MRKRIPILGVILRRTFLKPSFQDLVKKGNIGEEVIFNYLGSLGAKIDRFIHPSELTKTRLPNWVKKILRDVRYLKIDAIINLDGNSFYVDVKTKRKPLFWVNVEDYDEYYTLKALPFYIYFYVLSLKTIYKHKIMNPETFKIKKDSDGKLVYEIPQHLIEKVVLIN